MCSGGTNEIYEALNAIKVFVKSASWDEFCDCEKDEMIYFPDK